MTFFLIRDVEIILSYIGTINCDIIEESLLQCFQQI